MNTQYTDTILNDETLFYRFEIPSGSEVHAEVLLNGSPGDACGVFGGGIRVTDASDRGVGYAYDKLFNDLPEINEVLATSPTEIDDDEVFIRIRPDGECDTPVELDVELQLIVN